MESATWCWTPAAVSAARRLRPEVSKNSSTALSSNDGELARSITTCVPARASLRPSPVMVLTPVLGAAARPSWPPWRRIGIVFEPISPVPPITTIFIPNLLVPQAEDCEGGAPSCRRKCGPPRGTRQCGVRGSVPSTKLPRPAPSDGWSGRRHGHPHLTRELPSELVDSPFVLTAYLTDTIRKGRKIGVANGLFAGSSPKGRDQTSPPVTDGTQARTEGLPEGAVRQ